MTEIKPARYVEKYVTFFPDGRGGWDVVQWALNTKPTSGQEVYMIRIEVPRHLWDAPQLPTTVTPVKGTPPATAATSLDEPMERVCYSCSTQIRPGIDVLRWDGDKPRHAYVCPGGKQWPEDKTNG